MHTILSAFTKLKRVELVASHVTFLMMKFSGSTVPYMAKHLRGKIFTIFHSIMKLSP